MTTIEPAYVVDTHSLIWHLTNNKKLGVAAKEIFKAAEKGETQVIISSIVMAELYWTNKKHSYFDDFSETYNELAGHPAYQFASFSAHEVLAFDDNDKIDEMHDRMITGLAIRLEVPLITKDKNITESGLITIIWD